jgi:hypothetical protein
VSLELMSLVMKADLGTVEYLIPATDKRPEITGYLGTFDKHLLMVLADRGNPDGRSIYPSVEWMAKAMGATERAVRISLLRLKGTFPRLLVVERDHVSRYDTLHYMISVTALERVEQWKLRRKEQAEVTDVQPSRVNDVHPSRGLRGERSSSRAERHSLSTELRSAEPSVEPSVDQKHPVLRNGAAKSAQSAVQLGGVLLPEEVAVALEAPLEVPTVPPPRPAGPTHGSAAAPGAPDLAAANRRSRPSARPGRSSTATATTSLARTPRRCPGSSGSTGSRSTGSGWCAT